MQRVGMPEMSVRLHCWNTSNDNPHEHAAAGTAAVAAQQTPAPVRPDLWVCHLLKDTHTHAPVRSAQTSHSNKQLLTSLSTCTTCCCSRPCCAASICNARTHPDACDCVHQMGATRRHTKPACSSKEPNFRASHQAVLLSQQAASATSHHNMQTVTEWQGNAAFRNNARIYGAPATPHSPPTQKQSCSKPRG